MKILQKGFNYSQDGPGNRLVYHLQGCNFRCKWCSNPESMPLDFGKAEDVPNDAVVDEIERSRMMFFDGGGVTFTGGEPTLQPDDLIYVLKKAQALGVNTAIENNGSSPRLCEISDYVDYMIIDIKHPDDAIHKKYVGHSNKMTVENLIKLSGKRSQLHIRIPMINHVNTDPEPFAELFGRMNMENAVVEILAYHEYGKCKWTEEYEITDGFVSDEQIEFFKRRLEKDNIKIVST
ncbi:MAG TPA: pyruvate formate lyase-activating protein [Ruminococcaceae bacterium]|nr:pyruvate formate lyase-activating protein [Oscillospiraceae bacterium]